MRLVLVSALTLTVSCQSDKNTGTEVRLVDPTAKGDNSVVSRVVNVTMLTCVWVMYGKVVDVCETRVVR